MGILSTAVSMNLHLKQCDIKPVSPYDNQKETIYVRQPKVKDTGSKNSANTIIAYDLK